MIGWECFPPLSISFSSLPGVLHLPFAKLLVAHSLAPHPSLAEPPGPGEGQALWWFWPQVEGAMPFSLEFLMDWEDGRDRGGL